MLVYARHSAFLAVCGASDIATKPIASDRMVAELPDAQKITLQPGGHMALMEQNRQFSQAVDAFCATGSEISELP